MDFEADLSTMYAEIRRCMAVDFPEDFDPEIVQDPGKELVCHFGCFVLSDRAVVSLGAKFNNRDSPRDKTLHVRGAIFCPL